MGGYDSDYTIDKHEFGSKVKCETIRYWLASDGTRHDTEAKALSHERYLHEASISERKVSRAIEQLKLLSNIPVEELMLPEVLTIMMKHSERFAKLLRAPE